MTATAKTAGENIEVQGMEMSPSTTIGAAVALATILAAGPVSARTMVYISNADSREISVLELDAQAGELKPVQTVAVTGSAMPMAISPDRRQLYVSLRSQPFSVSSFAIDQQSGKLDLLSTVPLPDNMAYISTDRSGRFLLSASYTGDKIAINPIGPQGFVQGEPVQVVQTRKNAHAILTDRSNSMSSPAISAAISCCNTASMPRPGGLRRTIRPSSKRSREPVHAISFSTRTTGSSIWSTNSMAR
jgi:hypothetical protein